MPNCPRRKTIMVIFKSELREFSGAISLKINVIAQLRFELSCSDVTVQHNKLVQKEYKGLRISMYIFSDEFMYISMCLNV